MFETAAKPENVAYNPIDAENARTTNLGSVGDVLTHTLQSIRTLRRTCYRPLTSHNMYPDSTDIGDRTALKTVEEANNAFDVAVDTMRQNELLK